MTLHIVANQSIWPSCRAFIEAGDTLLLTNSAVALNPSNPGFINCAVKALKDDTDARNITHWNSQSIADYAEMVALCTQHETIINWS